MTTKPPEGTEGVKSGGAGLPGVQRFSHEAMATTFEIYILHEDKEYAEQAAWAAFEELDRLELDLSRYIENSDISRLNGLKRGDSLLLGPSAFECLLLAGELAERTGGAFDVTVGALMGCWLNEDKTLKKPMAEALEQARARTGIKLLTLDRGDFTVKAARAGVQVDLGGIGKGYAVDRMAGLLREWSIDHALIHGGTSSVAALDAPPGRAGWPVTISNPEDHKEILVRLDLRNQALSGSGLQKGRHIIDPRVGRPAAGKPASWVYITHPIGTGYLPVEKGAGEEEMIPVETLSSDYYPATAADALSTAFIVMLPEEIERYCKKYKNVQGMIALEKKGPKKSTLEFRRYGTWK